MHGERPRSTSVALTAAQAAKVVGLAPSTLAKLRLNGCGPPYCKLGRRVVYRAEDLGAWLETRIACNTADADARLPKSLTGCLGADEALTSRTGRDRLSDEAATILNDKVARLTEHTG